MHLSLWNTILVFMLTETRSLSSGERCYSLLGTEVMHSAWSHLNWPVWLGNPISKHISVCAFVRCIICIQTSFLLKQMQAFNLRLTDWTCSSYLSSRACGACLVQANQQKPADLIGPLLWSLSEALKKEICFPVPPCIYPIISINVPRVCSMGSQDFWKWETGTQMTSPAVISATVDWWVINGDLWLQ